MTYSVNPRVDIAFKKLFGVEENKDLLISLINSIVGPQDQVVDITLLNPYNPQSFNPEKLSILDIKAKGHDGKRFNIEIQMTDEADYDKRALYYWAKLYTEQLHKSEDYGTLEKAIGIHILNFLSIPGSDKYHNTFHVTEKETHIPYFTDLELHTLELKKFCPNNREDLSEFVKRVRTSLDRWLAFLTRHELLEGAKKLPPVLDDPNIKKALDVITVMNLSPQEREAYEAHLKWFRMEFSALKKVETKSFEKGKAKGKREGLAEGIKKGKAEGLKKGKAEGLAEGIRKIAQNMLKAGKPLEEIMALTGLSEEDVRGLGF